ncbi:centrosomal protein of 76 kDa isoform X2, partial [Thraustotheca clavata]
MADNISMEKLIALRTLIDTKLRDEGVYTQLRSLIQGTHAPDVAISNVLESDIVTQLIESIKQDKNLIANCNETVPNIEEKVICNQNTMLHLRILGGRAFIDCIDYLASSQSRQCFQLDIVFNNQRFSTNEVLCGVEPAFDATFLITLPTPTASTFEIIPKWEALCRIREPLHLILVKVLQKQLPQNLTGDDHATAHFPVQLEGPLKLAAGILDIRLDLIPFRKSTAIAHDVAQYLQKELLTINAIHTQFYQYSKQWWEEFTLEHEHNNARSIKIFTEDETHRYRMVCTYLTPLQSRYLTTPSEAARFVSLIPFIRSVAIGGGGRQDGWKSLPAFLSLGKGDCEEHTILLVSLLLGFGLDAYVALGSIRSKTTATI